MEIRVNTKGYAGRTLHKTMRVITNDPKNPEVVLKVSGPVAAFADIKPATISLRGDAGEPISGQAVIKSLDKYPFDIVRTTATANAKFTYELEKMDKEGETGWILKVTDPDPQGRYTGTVYLHTDNKIRPQLEVRVYGNFFKKKLSQAQSPAPPPKN